VRRRIARLLVVVATAALVLFVIVTITGGFLVRLGPLRFSAHNWRVPLLIALAAAIAAARVGRGTHVEAAEAVWSFIDRHAAAFAVVLAAATAGIGVGFGTYSASSSDASGYVSEAALIASARLSSDEPLARAVTWRNAPWTFSPLGYRPGADPGELVPTYPAGLPLVMTPLRLVGGELAAYLVVPLLGAVAVVATYFVGACLHSRYAGLIAAALLATSPIVLFQIVQPMSDVPAAAWWTIALLFALSPVSNAPLAAGAAAGLAILTRPNLLTLAIVIALAAMTFPRMRQLTEPQSPNHTRMPIERRPRPDRLLGFAAGLTPAIGALLLMQWRLYGNPLVSGYGTAGDLFSLSNIGPNLVGYSRRLIEGETPALLVFITAMVVLIMTRRGTSAAPPLKRPLVLATLALAIVVCSYLPYAVFAEWSYLRFLLPAFPLLFIAIGGVLTAALLRLPGSIRAPLLLCTLAAVASFNVLRADREQAFNMRRYESRYRLAGRYLDSALPPRAVIVAVQESGGVRYYTTRPILRWDWLDVDLDTAVAALRALGRHPVFVVEDWERSDVLRKHPLSTSARLDWRPRAEFGDETRVFLYDPLDRTNPPPWHPDRVH
jgi:Dolichyl-phosphate-mannose-protein mannosyltransferase